MSFGEAISSVFHNYATFSGRARRSEYWYFVLFNIVLMIISTIIQAATGENSGFGSIVAGLYGLYSLAAIIPGLAVCWRRLHDIGKSGAHYFLVLIPVVGAILLLVWACQDSQPGENLYGPNPKEDYKYF